MYKITYKVSGVPMTASFEDQLDLIMFVASNEIKDEDLVSINLNEDNDIEGGISGLREYAINKVVETKRAMEEAENTKTYVVDIYDNQNNKVDFVEIDAGSPEEAEAIASECYCGEDEYAVVQSECEDCGCYDECDCDYKDSGECCANFPDECDVKQQLYMIKENPSTVQSFPRYIQFGESGKPIIITRPKYSVKNVIAFRTKEDASDFLAKFIADRKRFDICWDIKPYTSYADVDFVDVITEYGKAVATK